MSGWRVWGKKCTTVLFSLAARSMQVLWAGSVVPESRMKHCGLLGEIWARVFRPRATEGVGVCEPGEHGERGSGKYELN
jgi:hypothetical protein